MALFPATSTAISDAVLALSCIWAFSSLDGFPWDLLKDKNGGTESANVSTYLAKVWFALTLAASCVGTVRFGRSSLFNQLGTWHEMLSWFVLVIGLPCLVAQYYINAGFPVLGNLHILLMLPPTFSWLGRNTTETDRISRMVALFCAVSLTGLAIYIGNYVLLLATILMGLASAVNDLQEGKFGLPPVDWFHYGITISNYLLVAALRGNKLPGVEMLQDKISYIFV
jgi:hypothetical protein